MEPRQEKKFLITGDLDNALNGFCFDEKLCFKKMFEKVGEKQFLELRQSVYDIYANLTKGLDELLEDTKVQFISDEILSKFLDDQILDYVNKGGVIVAIDRNYATVVDQHESCMRLDINRMEKEEGIRSLGSRTDESVDLQLVRIISRIKEHGGSVALCDDVLFNGGTFLYLQEMFQKEEVEIEGVFTGISNQVGFARLEEQGIKVSSLLVGDYSDSLCTRDTIFGCPQSGRPIRCGPSEVIEWRVPYFAPFGSASKYLAIPEEKEIQFSELCLENSLQFWQEFERASGKSEIRLSELPISVYGVNPHQNVLQVIEGALGVIQDSVQVSMLTIPLSTMTIEGIASLSQPSNIIQETSDVKMGLGDGIFKWIKRSIPDSLFTGSVVARGALNALKRLPK